MIDTNHRGLTKGSIFTGGIPVRKIHQSGTIATVLDKNSSILSGTGAYLTSKILDKFQGSKFNISDPFGFFGNSWFRSTRYWYYYSQYSNENDEFLPDIVQTYASMAVAKNQPVGDYIVGSIKNGRGNRLKQYYQYATTRFKNRYWNWELQSHHRAPALVDKSKLTKFLNSIFTNYKIIHQDNSFEPIQTYYYYWLQQTYGLDQFNTNYQGTDYHIIEPVKINNGYVIAVSDDGKKLITDTIPFKPSVGFIIWTGSDELELIDESDVVEEELLLDKDIPSNYPTLINTPTEVETKKLWKNPFNTSKETEETNQIDKNDPYSEMELLGELQIVKIVNLKGIENNRKVYAVSYKAYLNRMVKEHFIYVLEDGSSNYPEMTDIFTPATSEIKTFQSSATSKMFKFYPMMPIKEWDEGKDTETWTVPNFDKAQDVIDTLKHIQDIEEQNKDDKPSEVNAHIDRKSKQYQKKLGNKKFIDNGTEVGNKQKILQRRLSRAIQTRRKITYNELNNPSHKLSKSALKRHYLHMGKLLNQDLDMSSLQFKTDKNNIYERLVMPAVNFSSPTMEVAEYLYHFFNRLYRLSGKEESFQNWSNSLIDADSFDSLPYTQLSWKNQNGMDYGGLGYLFIRKLKIKGTVRKINKNHRVYEVKRGMLTSVTNLETLRELIEPSKELAPDKYYTSPNGVQHCIGGGLDNVKKGRGAFEKDNFVDNVLGNFNYTFFAKQSGSNELTVIAVAGLCFYTKMSQDFLWGHAWKDLEMQYQRNREKYVENKKDINVSEESQRKRGKKYYHVNVIRHFGIIPLEYNTLKKMGGVNLERFVARSVLTYGFVFNEVKGKRKGLKPFLKVVSIVLTIIAIVSWIFPPAGAPISLAVLAINTAIAIALAVTIQVTLKHVIMPLLAKLGLKGIIAVIVVVIILIAASLLGGSPANTNSVLPYATEVAKETAVESAKEMGTSITMESLKKAVEEMVKTGIEEISKNTVQLGLKTLDVLNEVRNDLVQDEVNKFQQQLEQDTKEFEANQRKLREKQEKIQPIIDVQEVLKAYQYRFKMYEPDTFINSNSMPDEFSASLAYLDSFIDMKLNIDPMTFDPISSLDFTFKPI